MMTGRSTIQGKKAKLSMLIGSVNGHQANDH
jgi:hypothetical protein